LREALVNLVHAPRRPLAAVSTRVIDVGVEPVLVCGVLRTEIPAVAQAEVADAHAGSGRMLRGVTPDHAQDDSDEVIGAPSPPRPVRRAAKDGIPREEELAVHG
jgi:hypothetical protein